MTDDRKPGPHAHIVGWELEGEWTADKVRHSHYGGEWPHYHDWHPALAHGDEYLPKALSAPVDERRVSHRERRAVCRR